MTPEALEILRYQAAGAAVFWSKVTGRYYACRTPCALHGIYRGTLRIRPLTLAALLEGGYMRSGDGRSNRHYYYITAKGRRALKEQKWSATSKCCRANSSA